MGRPPSLTPEVRDLICEAIKAGNYREVAAVWAGVSVRTLVRWCALGRKQEAGAYRDFWLAVLQAEKDAEMEMVGVVYGAAKADPDHAWKWLERKYGHRWGTQNREIRELKKRLDELEKAAHGRTQRAAPKGKAAGGAAR